MSDKSQTIFFWVWFTAMLLWYVWTYAEKIVVRYLQGHLL